MLKLIASEGQADAPQCVIRLSTEWWSGKNGLYTKKCIKFLRRQCVGPNVLSEDADAIGVEQTITRIINLDICADGLYRVVVCNEHRDWETGTVEDWDYRLVPLIVGEA